MGLNIELDLEGWLPALAALPRCRSLDLRHCGKGMWDEDAEFDAIAVRSGLANSPALQNLHRQHEALPLVAAERARRGPCVAIGLLNDEEIQQSLNMDETFMPDVCMNQCALLPLPQLSVVPSILTELCKPHKAAVAPKPFMS